MKKSVMKKAAACLSAVVLAGSGFSFNASARTPEGCHFVPPGAIASDFIYTRPAERFPLVGLEDLREGEIEGPQVKLNYKGIVLDMLNKYGDEYRDENGDKDDLGSIDFNTRTIVNPRLARIVTGSRDGLLNDDVMIFMRATSNLFCKPLRDMCELLKHKRSINGSTYEKLVNLKCDTRLAEALLYIRADQGVTTQECLKEYFTVLRQIAQQLANYPFLHQALKEWDIMVNEEMTRLGIND